MEIGVRLGLTIQVGDRDFFRPEISVEGIDPEGDVEKQLDIAFAGLSQVFEKMSNLLFEKVKEYVGKGK